MWQELWTALRTKAKGVYQVLRREIWRTDNAIRDRAHMATLGDRPFPGCRPCEPAIPCEPSAAPGNPPASPKEV